LPPIGTSTAEGQKSKWRRAESKWLARNRWWRYWLKLSPKLRHPVQEPTNSIIQSVKQSKLWYICTYKPSSKIVLIYMFIPNETAD
jgi:hypothetical protein